MTIKECLSIWIQSGKPEGAMCKKMGLSGTAVSLSEIISRPIEEIFLDTSSDNVYLDPPEQWLPCAVCSLPLMIGDEYSIRCRPKSSSLDNAYDDWFSIEGILLSDINNFDYQYLSPPKKSWQ